MVGFSKSIMGIVAFIKVTKFFVLFSTRRFCFLNIYLCADFGGQKKKNPIEKKNHVRFDRDKKEHGNNESYMTKKGYLFVFILV